MAADESHDDKTQSFTALTSGTSVLHYKILEKIGSGGMGEVYLALDTKLNRKVALKFLPPHLCQDEDCRKRFTREAQAAAGLDHPNIAAIHEVDEFQGRPFYAMQVVEGQALRELAAGKDLPIERILEIAIQMCEGLQVAHDNGIVHRDIKPSNILVDSHGRVRIVDFGLAAIRGTDQLTKTGSTLGTIGYMSPEQVQGEEIDHRSDLFSLGVVLYELITKQNPFKRDTEAATLRAVSDSMPEPLARFKRDVPEFLESVIAKLLEKRPAHRYQSAAGVTSDLQRLKEDSGSAVSAKLASKTSMRYMRIILPITVVLLVVAALVLKPWRFDISPRQDVIAAENRLAILYFDNLIDSTDSLRLGEIVTNLLITDLSESKYVNVVSGQRLYDILKQLGHEGEKRIDRRVATQVAEVAGARWMLLGSILNTEPDIVVAAQLVDITSGDAFASQRVEGQPGERIFSVVDQLTAEIREDLSLPSGAIQEVDPEVAEITTHSSEAYRHYLQGLDLFHRHIWLEAEEEFLKAIYIDSTFSMAHFGLARMAYWQNDPQAETHIASALKYSDHVNQKDGYHIHVYEARINRDIPRAIDYLHKIIERYPDDKDAYISLGITKKYETNELEEAITYFRKATELDPFHREAHNQLAYAYTLLGRFEEAILAINKYIEIAPDEANPYDSRGEILAMNGKLDEAIASYEKAMELQAGFGRSSLANLYMFRGDYAKADSLYHAMVSDASKRIRASGRLALTKLPRHQGKFQEALRLLEVGIATDSMELGACPEIAEKLWTRAVISDFFFSDRSILEDLNQAVSILREHEAKNLYSGVYQAYFVSELVRGGELPAADSLMTDITARIIESGYPDSVDFWLASGFTALKLRRYDSAAVYWEKAVERLPYQFAPLLYLSMSYLGAGQLGNAVETLEKTIDTYDETRGSWPGLSVLCHYLLGKAYEASGWTDKAITEYETFLDIWKNADPGIKEIDDARLRLARLRGGS